MTEKEMEVFFDIHNGLPREGPGSTQSTQIAYSCIRNKPDAPKILDVGCGPGAQTFCLANLSAAEICAVDNHAAFVDRLQQSAADRHMERRIHPTLADMTKLVFEDGTFDIIWAEGSIYINGVENSLKLWRPFLKKTGSIAFTEISWLIDEVPQEPKQFWLDSYPEMSTVEGNVERIASCGFELTGYFVLPESDWWDEYYDPISKKLPTLYEKYKADAAALKVLDMQAKEIDLYREHADYYGYVFYIAEKQRGSV